METRQIAIRSLEYESELLAELKYLGVSVVESTDSMLWLTKDKVEPAWADCVWRDVRRIKIDSIADAQKKLKLISKHWRYHGDLFNRRGALIAQGLMIKETDYARFPTSQSSVALPVFTMAAADTIYYSLEVRRPTVDGKIKFIEDKDSPPSRAYLKLWEALTVLGDWPQSGEHVLDLGSSPGSWSWALAQLGAQVLSIDRSELSARVMKMKGIEFRKGDAFSVEPHQMDWVVSDVICFPEKLYDYMQTWLKTGLCEKFVCNLKFKGKADPRIVDRFRRISHSRVVHLMNAKNEITWIRHPKL